jgi:hypothetical protein
LDFEFNGFWLHLASNVGWLGHKILSKYWFYYELLIYLNNKMLWVNIIFPAWVSKLLIYQETIEHKPFWRFVFHE